MRKSNSNSAGQVLFLAGVATPRMSFKARQLAGASFAAMLIALASINMAEAQGLTEWTGNLSSDWNDDGNWSYGTPGSNDFVMIDISDEVTVHTDDAEALELNVGINGQGSLKIENGGQLTVKSAQLGVFNGAQGMTRVTGANSALVVSGEIVVGNNGAGLLLIDDGARVESVDGRMGVNALGMGTVVVAGEGSEWINSGDLIVAQISQGQLIIQEGALVQASNTDIAIGGDSVGQIVIGGVIGDDALASGTLKTLTLRFGDGNGTLVLNHTDTDYVLSADMSGNGLIEHYSGETRFTGDSTEFTGTTMVRGGSLSVDDALGGQLVVVEDGTLRGTGTIGDLYVLGVIAPGNSVGTMTATGNAVFEPDSIFRIYADASGASRLNVGGSAVINGGEVEVVSLLIDGDKGVVGTHTILQSTGLSGEFDAVSANYAFLDPSLTYDANNVYLVLGLLNDEGLTEISHPFVMNANQSALAATLDSLNEDDPRYQGFYNSFIALGEDDVSPALEELSGSRMASATTLVLPAATSLVNNIQNSSVYGLSSGDLDRPTSWARIIGTSGKQDNGNDMPGSDIRSTGIETGIEAPFGDTFLVGAALGLQEGSISSGGLSTVDNEITSLAFYGQYNLDRLRISGALGYSGIENESTRLVPQFGQQTASFDSEVWISDVVIAYDWIEGTGGLTITPLAGLRYTSLNQDAYTEDGPVALDFSSFNSDSLRTRIGAEVSHDIKTKNGTSIAVNWGAVWSHEVGDPDTTMQASLLEGQSFDVKGQGLPRDMVELGFAVHAEMSDNVRLTAGYSGNMAEGYRDHSVQAGFSFVW